jgi:predicted RNA-binding Zn-ribbon protein involved in translation (DUF1610 family)
MIHERECPQCKQRIECNAEEEESLVCPSCGAALATSSSQERKRTEPPPIYTLTPTLVERRAARRAYLKRLREQTAYPGARRTLFVAYLLALALFGFLVIGGLTVVWANSTRDDRALVNHGITLVAKGIVGLIVSKLAYEALQIGLDFADRQLSRSQGP